MRLVFKTIVSFLLLANWQVSAQCPNSVLLGSASNMVGVINNETTPVAVDNSINTVVFLHRNNVSVFGLNTGHLRYDVSFNAGQTWSTNIGVLNPTLTFGARYPNAFLYSPVNNTLATNASIGYYCAAIPSNWGAVVSGRRQLSGAVNTENYNQPGILNYFIPQSVVKSTQNTYWALDYESNGINVTGSLMVMKGVWNATANDVVWTLNTTITGAINTAAWGYPIIGFDPSGQIGYIAFMTDATASGYYSPVIYKSTNGGQTWSGPTVIDLNQFSCITSNMSGANVNVDRQIGMVVDVNGAAHIMCIVGKQSGYNIDATAWHHVVDLTVVSGLWTIRDLNALQTDRTFFNGSVSGAYSHGWSPQAARSADGSKIFFTWTDNSSLSLGAPINSPNLFAKGFDALTNSWTQTKDLSSCGASTSGKIYFPHIAREVLFNNNLYKIAPVYGEFSTTANDPEIPTSYRFLDNCVFATSEFTTAIPTVSLSINPSPEVILCPGSQVPVQLLGNYNQILWSNSATTSITTVSSTGALTVTARQGCTVGSKTIAVQQLTFSASSSSVTVCAGSSVTLSTSGNALSYTWSPGQIVSSSVVVSPTVSSAYTLTAEGSACVTSSIVSIAVNPLPAVGIISNYTRTCAGNSVVIQAAGASLYSWSNGATGPSVTVSPSVSTIYSVTALNSFGCLKTFTVSQFVDPIPELTLTCSPAKICAGETSSISVLGAFSYFWNTGSTSSTFTVSPSAATVYTVIGTNTLLCTSSATVEQKVDKCVGLDANIKDPNGLEIFPNPTSKGVFLNAALSGNLKIVNGMGVLVTEHSLTASKSDWIDTSWFLNGVYFFVFQTEAGESVVKKVIVANN